jgi:5-hydroxyisourate hydrolase-like protein (transthyretin family)
MLTLTLLALLSLGSLQERAPATPPSAHAPASPADNEPAYRVAGTVVDAVTGAPLNNAQVTLTARDSQGAETMLTDDNGRFAFDDVPAGKFVLSAKRKGYLEQLYKQHQQFSTAIVTGPELNTENLRFDLHPGASISGVITDEAGEPVRNAQIFLIQRELLMGRRTSFQRAGTATNDLGRFRFAQLTPGTYFIAASATPWYAQRGQQVFFDSGDVFENGRHVQQSGSRFIPPPPELDVVYPMTFFPNSPDLAGAAPITLRSGDAEVADIRLQAVPGAHITLRTPAPKEGTGVWAHISQELVEGQRFNVPAATQQIAPGVWEISGVPPGRFDVDLAINDGTGNHIARRQSVQVSGASADLVLGEANSPVKLSGVARFDDGSEFNSPPRLQVKSTATGAWYQLPSEKDGTFEMKSDGLPPGPYEIWVMQSRDAEAVRSIKATNAKVTSGRAFDITGAGDVKLEVILSRGTGSISGFALKDGKPLDAVMVALVPENPEHNLVLFRRDQSDSDGSFNLPGIHPGKYTVIALENGWDIEWLEPGALRKYLAAGQRVQVTPNARLEVKVSVQ